MKNELDPRREGSELLADIHRGSTGLGPAKPFEREVFLFDTYVAGTSHIENIEALEPDLEVGDRLDFYREAHNQYDTMAIVVTNRRGDKLGYIPQIDNEIFSRLMDAGKVLFGRISRKEFKGRWLKIDIKIYLED